MNIEVIKLTDLDLMKDMIEFSDPNVIKSTMTLKNAYKRQHSTIRSQLFYIKVTGIPTFVSVHLVRHSATGQFHYVSSNREDINPSCDKVDRDTPVNHVMLLNAQHLIDMGKARLCGASHPSTVFFMEALRNEVLKVDEDLGNMMAPQCYYYGYCPEYKCCGRVKKSLSWRIRNYGR